LRAGVIIPREGLKERLSLLDKLEASTAKIAYATGAAHLVISDSAESCVFKMAPVNGTFPEYQQIIDKLRVEAREVDDMHSTAYDTGYLKDVGSMAKMLESKSARIFAAGPGESTLITFPENPQSLMILMPVRTDAAIGVGAAKVLAGAINGTVGALRAHRTRWAVKADAGSKAAGKKVAEYDERIAAILAAAHAVPALPAPEGYSEEVAEEQGPAAPPPSFAMADAIEPAPPAAEKRQSLAPGQRKKAMTRFLGDVNAVLNGHGGLTVDQLADGVPIDDWFDAGLDVETVATRCLDWRRIGTVLPPDEVRPGEAELPVALLGSPHRAVIEQPDYSDPLGTPADLAALIERHAAIEPASLDSSAPDEPDAITVSPEAAVDMTEAADAGRQHGKRHKQNGHRKAA
jgi:hypothetical protein